MVFSLSDQNQNSSFRNRLKNKRERKRKQNTFKKLKKIRNMEINAKKYYPSKFAEKFERVLQYMKKKF